MKRKTLDFSVMKEEISQNNVLEMAELNCLYGTAFPDIFIDLSVYFLFRFNQY